jgi:hypothetical protein
MSGTKKPEVPRMTVGPGRISWPEIDPPAETPDGLRYKMTLLLPPTLEGKRDAKRITDACMDLWVQKYGADPKAWPANARTPDKVVRDAGTKPNYAGYEAGWSFFSCSTAERPGIVNGMLEPVADLKDLYAGRWAKISVRPFLYTIKGVGVSLGLSNIQLLKHDSVFGRSSPAQDFDVVAEEMSEDF